MCTYNKESAKFRPNSAVLKKLKCSRYFDLSCTLLAMTADPNTVKWLKTNLDPVFGYPTVVRFSWSTCRELLEDRAVEVQW